MGSRHGGSQPCIIEARCSAKAAFDADLCDKIAVPITPLTTQVPSLLCRPLSTYSPRLARLQTKLKSPRR